MEIREYMSKLGKRGGSKGGNNAARRMTKAARIARARKAGIASGKVRSAKAKAKKGA